MLQQNTRESAVRREEFHRALRTWLNESFDACVGEPESHAGHAWFWVRHGGEHYYLDASATREGIRRYIREVEQNNGDPQWGAADPVDDVRERVTIGRNRDVIEGFEFYRHLPPR